MQGAVSEDARVVLRSRMIENPLATEGNVQASVDRGETTARWTPGIVNMVALVGGVARMKGLSEAQLAAAGRWRALSELAQIGGAVATDYAAVRVDTSASGRDVVMDGAAARREITRARVSLGPFRASILDQMICEEKSVRDLAKAVGGGGHAQMLTQKRVREALDELVEHFAHGRRRIRKAGEAAGDWSVTPADAGGDDPKAH